MYNKMTIAVLGLNASSAGVAKAFAEEGFRTIIATMDSSIPETSEEICELIIRLSGKYSAESDILEKSLWDIELVSSVQESVLYADMVIDCSGDDLETLQERFSCLDRYCAPSTILAISTTNYNISDVAAKAIHKERILGTCFCEPVDTIPLVEVVKTSYVSEDVVNQTCRILEGAARVPAVIKKDEPGRLTREIRRIIVSETEKLILDDVADLEDIKKAVVYGFGSPNYGRTSDGLLGRLNKIK